VAIYSESTVLPEDRALLPFVMGSSARTAQNAKDVSISANRPVRYQYAAQREKKSWWSSLWHGSTYEPWPVPQVDGLPMPCGTKGRVLLGAGSHQLVIPDKVPKTDTTWIKDITMPFTKAQPTKMGFTMDYSAQRRSWVTVSREPSAVLVDGQVLPPTAIRLLDLDWIVELPAGEHQLEIQEATTAAAVVRQAGEGATSSIVWAGFRGLLLLIVLYSAVRVRRLWRRFARKPKSKEAETNHV